MNLNKPIKIITTILLIPLFHGILVCLLGGSLYLQKNFEWNSQFEKEFIGWISIFGALVGSVSIFLPIGNVLEKFIDRKFPKKESDNAKSSI